MVDQWTDPVLAHERVGYWIGEAWLFDRIRPDDAPIPDLTSVQSPDYISVSALLGQNRPTGKSVTLSIAEIYEYVVPDWCLRTPCPVRERTRKPYLPENVDSEETYLSDLYARQIADAQMRATRRGQKAGSPPAYLFAPVVWSDTGNVFVFRPTWTINTSEDEVEEYLYASPALNRLDGESPYSAVRKFTDAEEAKSFLANENAYPRRPHYVILDGEANESLFS
jgi:hypothetical protein